jgi:hypothetical protein
MGLLNLNHSQRIRLVGSPGLAERAELLNQWLLA